MEELHGTSRMRLTKRKRETDGPNKILSPKKTSKLIAAIKQTMKNIHRVRKQCHYIFAANFAKC